MSRRPAALLAAFLVPVVVAGCLTTPVTTEGREVARLYGVFIAAAAVVAAIVVGLTTWSILRYRRRRDVLPAQVHGSLRLEVIWTVLPAVTIAGLFALTVLTLVRVDAAEDPPGVEVEVTAFRWGWSFDFPGEDVTIVGIGEPGPEILLPVGEPIRFTVTGGDVIHAFFVPQFFVKRDMIPGHVNTVQLTIEEPGTYGGQCAEYCGLYHARMPFTIRATDRAAFEAWLGANRAGGETAP